MLHLSLLFTELTQFLERINLFENIKQKQKQLKN